MAGLDDEEHARDDAARAEEEWGSEFERQAEHDVMIDASCPGAGETGDNRDITPEQLLELLADDEMIEGGYDRDGMVTLLLLARAALRVLVQQQDELRTVLDGRLTVWATWKDGAELPEDVGLSDPDGDPIDVELSAGGLIEEVRRRQAREIVRRYELGGGGAPLELLLGLVPPTFSMQVSSRWSRGCNVETWETDPPATVGPVSHAEAIRVAVLAYLGLPAGSKRAFSGSPAAVVKAAIDLADAFADRRNVPGVVLSGIQRVVGVVGAVEQLRGATAEEERQTCSRCSHWGGEQAVSGDGKARWCSLGDEWRHPDGWCDDWVEAEAVADTDPAPESPPLPKGVTRPAPNVLRSEGGDDVDSE